MATLEFLETIYRGNLDAGLFHSFSVQQDSLKLARIVDAYREILRRYPSQDIEARGGIPGEMLKEMAYQGLFGLSIPEAYGGLGFNLWEYMKAIEEMVRLDISLALASIAHLSIGVKGIQLFGNESQKQKYLTPAASGEMIFSYALTEPRVGSDAQHIETRADLSEDGSHYILNGQKTYITNANYAGGLTVFAQLDSSRPGFMGAFIVETAWDGVKIGKDMPKMGLKASSTAAIQFKNVEVPRENILGKPGDGFKIAMTVLNYGRLGLGAASAGMINQSIEDMMKRSSTRMQFGQPIKNFPLIQEKIVRAKTHGLVISSMNEFIVSLLQQDPYANLAIETSHCKLFGTTRAWDVLYDALQVSGGSGYLSTQPYEKRMRDFRVATVFEGTTEIHSIYPAIFMMRKISKDLEPLKGSITAKLRFLAKCLLGKGNWPLEFQEKTMRRASRLAKGNARTFRRMLFWGILFYGKKLFQKEFFLRRATAFSLYLFGILAVLAKTSADEKRGFVDPQHMRQLQYFLEEAKDSKRKNGRIRDSAQELLIAKISEDLFSKAGKL